jgi:hypothetical protein
MTYEPHGLRWMLTGESWGCCGGLHAVQMERSVRGLQDNRRSGPRAGHANFLRTLDLPQEVGHWTLTTLREKLVKIGARTPCPHAELFNGPGRAWRASGLPTGSAGRCSEGAPGASRSAKSARGRARSASSGGPKRDVTWAICDRPSRMRHRDRPVPVSRTNATAKGVVGAEPRARSFRPRQGPD